MKLKASTYNQFQTLCWTEDNRLQAVKDNQMGAYYNYDASGERNLKLTGNTILLTQNGEPYDYVLLESPTLYASGLITINEKGYTKHYFEENKRVCSNIGGGFRYAGYDIMDSIELITPFLEQWRNAKDGIFKTFDECIKSPVDLENTTDKIVKVMKDHEKNRNEAEYQFYYTNDHLGSSTYITNQQGQITQTLAYLPYGEDWVDLDNQPPYLTPYKFNGKEKDEETGYNYFGARYQSPKLSIWLSVDPNSDNYPHSTSYAYCNNNPIMLIDPDGKDWEDADGNKVKDHSNIKAYIFYDPKSFSKQSKQMANNAIAKYGKGSVAMSNVTTEKEFAQDWGDMGGKNIKEVNVNYHGNNQTIMLNSSANEYITATGDGKTNKSNIPNNINVQDLPTPAGNISNAQLNLNTCKSNSRTQYPLQGSRQTLMEAFYSAFNFQTVRGTSAGVSYNRITKSPEPQFFFQHWDYFGKVPSAPKPSFNISNSIYYRTGGMK